MVRSKRKRLIGLVAAVFLASSAMLAATATSAPAAAGCDTPGPLRVTPTQGDKPLQTWRCFVYRPDVLINDAGDPVGSLKRGTSWFACQVRSPRHNEPVHYTTRDGRPAVAESNYWLFTLSDSTPRKWGWFPANKIAGGNNHEPIRNVKFCEAIDSIPGPLPLPR